MAVTKHMTNAPVPVSERKKRSSNAAKELMTKAFEAQRNRNGKDSGGA